MHIDSHWKFREMIRFRDKNHRWDPKNQRPELWNLYNGKVHKGESIRVFPLSNWTELDVWQYIHLEKIPIVPLYLAAKRPVVERDGTLVMVDDDRMPIDPGEVIEEKMVRFRTLGCYPLTGAVDIANFPGVSSPYEPPADADLVLATDKLSVDQCVEQILKLLEQRKIVT